MISLLLASFLAAQQVPSTFTLLEPAAPLSRLIPELSKLVNKPLDVAPTLASDVVCIDVHDVTSKDLLDRLAWATVGEWEQTKSGAYRLIPAAGIRAQQSAEELKRRAAQIQKYLNPPKPAEDDPRNAALADADSISMGELDGGPLLRLVDPSILASIPEGGRVVFSTRPNRMQFPFSTDISQEVNAMIAKHNEEAEKAKLAAKPKEDEFRSELKPIPNTVDKVLLAVTPCYFGDEEAVEGEVILYDKNGKDITGNRGSSASSGPSDADTDESKPIVLSHESKLFAQFVASETGGLGMMEMLRFRSPDKPAKLAEEHRTEALQRFLAPDRYDPLAYVSDLLRSLAHVKGDQVVACIPDSFACNIGLVFEGELTEKSLRTGLTQNKDMDIRFADGWISGRPRDPVTAEAERVDRKQLAQALGTLQTAEYLRLADKEAVAKLGFNIHPDSLVSIWCTLARPSYFGSDWADDWDMVRLYATLDGGQLQALDTQHSVPLISPNAEQIALINRMVYGPKARLFLRPEPDSAGDETMIDPEMTEVFPNGLPPEISLTLSAENQTAVQAIDRTGQKYRHVLGAEPMSEEELIQGAARLDVANSHLHADNGDDTESFTQDGFATGLPKELRLGSIRKLEFGIGIAKKLMGSTTLVDPNMSGNGTISYAQLKSQMKAEYDEAYQVQVSISSFHFGGGVSGGGTPPPPP